MKDKESMGKITRWDGLGWAAANGRLYNLRTASVLSIEMKRYPQHVEIQHYLIQI